MHGNNFLLRVVRYGLVYQNGKIKDWERLLVYICPDCGLARIFWHDEMRDADHIGCKTKNCHGTMILYNLSKDQAKANPRTWERIEYHSALGL